MADNGHASMEEIRDAFDRLADRVQEGLSTRVEGFISLSIRRAAQELRRYAPGLDLPSYRRPEEEQPAPLSTKVLEDQSRAASLERASTVALADGDNLEALARALRGLSLAPHHPGLWYLVAGACFELGAIEDAISALRHTLWIHPGHRRARRDLAALNLYLRDRSENAGGSDDTYPPDLDFSSAEPRSNQDSSIAPTNAESGSEDDPPRPDAEEEYDSDE